MATTSANHIHGNTISHPGNNICHKKITTTSGTPFGTTDDQSGNANSHKKNKWQYHLPIQTSTRWQQHHHLP